MTGRKRRTDPWGHTISSLLKSTALPLPPSPLHCHFYCTATHPAPLHLQTRSTSPTTPHETVQCIPTTFSFVDCVFATHRLSGENSTSIIYVCTHVACAVLQKVWWERVATRVEWRRLSHPQKVIRWRTKQLYEWKFRIAGRSVGMARCAFRLHGAVVLIATVASVCAEVRVARLCPGIFLIKSFISRWTGLGENVTLKNTNIHSHIHGAGSVGFCCADTTCVYNACQGARRLDWPQTASNAASAFGYFYVKLFPVLKNLSVYICASLLTRVCIDRNYWHAAGGSSSAISKSIIPDHILYRSHSDAPLTSRTCTVPAPPHTTHPCQGTLPHAGETLFWPCCVDFPPCLSHFVRVVCLCVCICGRCLRVCVCGVVGLWADGWWEGRVCVRMCMCAFVRVCVGMQGDMEHESLETNARGTLPTCV